MIRLIRSFTFYAILAAVLFPQFVAGQADASGSIVTLNGDWNFVADPTGGMKVAKERY